MSTKMSEGSALRGVVTLVAIGVAIYYFNKPSEQLAAPPDPIEFAPKPLLPYYVTTASSLYRDYEANEVATNMKIGKAPVQVTGIVLSIDEGISGSPRVALSTGSSMDHALFSMLDTEKTEVAKLSKGDAATFRCASMQRLLGSPIGSKCTMFSHLGR
jgi:hypothetical protein